MSKPLVTVLMSVYNGEKFLREAIESILSQIFTDFEFLIINDASTDSSREIVLSYQDDRIRLIDSEENIGLTKSLNKGLKLARGEYIARMDADDISAPERLQKQFDYLENNPSLTVVGSWAFLIDENGKPIGESHIPADFGSIMGDLFFYNPIMHSTTFFNKEFILRIGGYDENFIRAQDYELWIRIIKNKGKIQNIPEYIIKYRFHLDNITTLQFNRQEDTARKIIKIAYKKLLNKKISIKKISLMRELFLERENITSINKLMLYFLLKGLKKRIKHIFRNNDAIVKRFEIRCDSLISPKYLEEFVKRIIKSGIRKFILHVPLIGKYYSRITQLQAKYNELLNENNKLLNENNALVTELATAEYHNLNENLKKYSTNITISNKLKKILAINTLSDQGGAAKITHQLHDSLKKVGYNCKMLVNESSEKSEDVILLEQDNSVKQKYLLDFQYKEGWLDFFHLASFDIVNMELFKNADIIHLHNLHGSYFSYFALPRLSSLKPVVWTLHDMQAITGHCAHSFDCEKWRTGCGDCPDLTIYPVIAKDSTSFIWENKKNIYRNSNFTIVTPSCWIKNKVESSILSSQDIRLIYNGVNEKVFQNIDKTIARNQLHLPVNKKILLFAADLGINNPWKGSQYLLDAYSILKDDDDYLFINIGGSIDKKNGNWLDVSYIRDEKTLALYYAAADLFIYPSLADNCPLTVLESLSCGTPVVSFKTGGIPELVEHGKTGYIAEYKDLNDFISGINLLMDNEILRRKASIEGRNIIEEKFTIDIMVDSYLKVYQELIQKHQHNKSVI
jgi:glycosyltransferase involved in cell wall biosynthesis